MVLTWLQTDVESRRKHAGRLLKQILWKKLPSSFLLKVLLRHPLLDVDSRIKDLVLNCVRQSYNDDGDDERIMIAGSTPTPASHQQSAIQEIVDLSLPKPTSPSSSHRTLRRPSFSNEALLLIGGLTLGEAERGDISQPNCMCYHPIKRTWRQRAAWPERGLRGFSVSKFENNVIVSG